MSYAERFLDGYLDAWRTNDPDSIRALFAPNATYRSGARDLEPAAGIDEIVERWLEERDELGTWSYSGAVELQTKTAAVIRGVTAYTEGQKSGTYENVWLVRFDDEGQATEFQDWWFQREG